MNRKLWMGLPFLLLACTNAEHRETTNNAQEEKSVAAEAQITLTASEAERLVYLPLGCIDIEYPNKLNQVIGGDDYLKSPEELHPAFYGCFDWHSAVHGHWSLVNILKSVPDLKEREGILRGLKLHLSKENIAGELVYFDDALSQGFERMYGWAWLLKLAEELHTWDIPEARELEENLQPLTDLISSRCKEFLPKLHYPIRVGTHTNTAFAMSLAYDYATAVEDEELKSVIEERSRDFYLSDADCPLTWEPSGYDFLSPCLEEANLMRKVLPVEEYQKWLGEFLPDLSNADFHLEPGIVSDRQDGHLVHLDGLNFSRAWCLFGIANDFPNEYGHLVKVGNDHMKHSLPQIVDDHYEGGHWLASFALLAMKK